MEFFFTKDDDLVMVKADSFCGFDFTQSDTDSLRYGRKVSGNHCVGNAKATQIRVFDLFSGEACQPNNHRDFQFALPMSAVTLPVSVQAVCVLSIAFDKLRQRGDVIECIASNEYVENVIRAF